MHKFGACCKICGKPFLRIGDGILRILRPKGESEMKKEEKEPVNWEIKDPKPPVIQSGHMENRKR